MNHHRQQFLLRFARAACAFGLTCAALPAFAQAPLFKGNQVYLVVGSDVGGGYDTYARLLARHLGDHLPDRPTIVVQNMPGAGSLKAMNYIANVAPKDGSYFGAMQSGIGYEPMMGVSGGKGNVHFDPLGVNWVGSMAKDVAVTVLWNPTPIKSFSDLRTTPVTIGSSGPSTSNSIYARLMNAMFETKFKIVEGYSNQAPIYLAMEHGEVQGSTAILYSSLTTAKPDWLRDRKVSIVVQIGLEKEPSLPDVPLLYDLAKSASDKQSLRLALDGLQMGYPFVLPQGVPADRVKMFRDAFMATMRDPALLDEAKTMRLAIKPIDGDAVHRLIEEMYATPQPIIDKVGAIFVPNLK